MQILVSLSCTMCPDLVVAAQRIASLNPLVTAEVYDIVHFPELKEKYNVMSVPTDAIRLLDCGYELRLLTADDFAPLYTFSTTARQQGLLALENSIASASDDFTRDGIQMIVDGVDKDALKEILEQGIAVEEAKYEPYAKMLEAMGGYSPTMGIIGAVLGLIHAMSLLDRPDELGPAIAVAFVATIYGLVLANLICLPASNLIKGIVANQTLYKYMTLEGLVSIAAGENTMMLKRRLAVYAGEKNENA